MHTRILVAVGLMTSIQFVSAGIVSHSSTDIASLAGASLSAAGSRVIITYCEVPADYSEGLHQAKLGDASPDVGSMAIPAELKILTLIKQDGIYDVVIGSDSLASKGTIFSAGEGYPLHLVFDGKDSPGVEHFLFDLNLDGSGELLWSSAAMSALTTCVAGDKFSFYIQD